MKEPSSVKRNLVKMSAYRDHVVASFAFSVDFSSTVTTLTATLSVETNKTVPVKDIEQMADNQFLELLRVTLAKGLDEIQTNI
jgi:hypothetical protein